MLNVSQRAAICHLSPLSCQVIVSMRQVCVIRTSRKWFAWPQRHDRNPKPKVKVQLRNLPPVLSPHFMLTVQNSPKNIFKKMHLYLIKCSKLNESRNNIIILAHMIYTEISIWAITDQMEPSTDISLAMISHIERICPLTDSAPVLGRRHHPSLSLSLVPSLISIHSESCVLKCTW